MEAATAAELMRAIAERRDRAAFTELFRRYAPQVKRYLVSRGAGPSEAEELTQEVMLTVWRRAETFDPTRAAPSTWIFTIARNRRLDQLRQRPPLHESKDFELMEGDGVAADAAGVAAERSRGLREALESLPPEQAEVLRAAYFEDKSLGTMAAERSIPLGTVKSRVRLAMGRLRAVIKMDREA